MKGQPVLIIAATILVRAVTGQELPFEYLDGDVFGYVSNTEPPGLSLMPSAGGKEKAEKLLQDRERIRAGLLKDPNVFKVHCAAGESLLTRGKEAAFLQLCGAFARAGVEDKMYPWLGSLLSDDPKRNFIVLYGAYVYLTFEQNLAAGNNKLGATALIKRSADRPIWKGGRFSDIRVHIINAFRLPIK